MANIRVQIPTALRRYAGGQDTVELEADGIDGALKALVETHADLKNHLYNEEGALRNFVNIYLNDEDIRYLDRDKTELKDGDGLTIVPAVAGGGYESVITDIPLGLSKEELERYSRHLIMPDFGLAAQKKLKNSSVLLVGTGGLGSPTALYLAAAGVGKLGLVDFDVVDHSNLQRQIIHTTPDVGRPKIESAVEKIKALNPHVEVETYETLINSDNAMDIVRPYDVVLDGTDNFQTRYLMNDVSVLLGKPNIYGSIFQFEGQASVFWADHGPCYRCLYPEPPPPGLVPSCAEGGVLGILPGIIGVIQATETIKVLTGIGEPLIGRLMLFDALSMKFRELKLRKDPNCPLCGENPTITELIDYDLFCGIGGDVSDNKAEPISAEINIDPDALHAELNNGASVLLVDVREPHEAEICTIEHAHSLLIPQGEVPNRLGEIDKDADIVVYCRTGMRSAKIAKLLQGEGYKVRNLEGGILQWIDDIDPSMPRY